MNYEHLDHDTKSIIDAMCTITGKTKEQAILALVEFGMVSMVAAISPDKREKMMKVIFDVVNKDVRLTKTAEAYKGFWSFPE